jgi:putative PEP-CTERM system TPR-repeat lipoprotein
MKNRKISNKNGLAVLALSLLASSSLVSAATYDPSKNTDSNVNQIALPEAATSSASTLELLQRSEAEGKKSNYIEVLNLLKQNKTKEAREKVTALIKQTPNEAEFYNLQALVEIMEKNTFAAQQSYQKTLQLNPQNITAYLGLAKIDLETGDLNKAKEYASKAVGINDKAIPAYMLLADVALKQKNNAEVETVLTNALSKVKGNLAQEIEILQNLGKFYASQKQPEKILALSEDLVNRYPTETQALSVLAGTQIVNNKKELAEKTLRQIVEKEPKDINHRLLLAKLLAEQTGKDADVLKLLDDAIAVDNNNPQAAIFKAAYLVKLQRFPEAMELANKVDTQFPKLVLGKLLKGDVFLAEKKLDKALEIYQQVYKIQPDDKVLFTLTDLMFAQKKSPDAVKLLESAVAKNPKNGAIHFKLATLQQALGNNTQAETHYKAILADQADNVLALNNLALLYSQQNNPQAIELAKKAYDKAPDAAAIADTYGYILVKQGKAADGLVVLEKAATSAPEANDVQFHLADAYAANNNKVKAIEILEKIVKLEFAEKVQAVSLLDKLKAN